MSPAILLILSFSCVALLCVWNYMRQNTKPFVKAAAVLVSIFTATTAHAEKVYDFNATCQQAYQEIISLKLNAGVQLINQARKENPDNLIPEILDSYIDFFVLFFNEDPADYKIRMPHFSERLDVLEEGPESSPFYNYCRTVLYMQKASVEIKFGKQWAAGWDFKRAFNLIRQNKKDFPAFLPNNMVYGPLLVIAGTIPDGYKWFTSLFGIKGSIKDGITIMQQFVNSNDTQAKLFFNEASFYYCYVLFYIQNKPDDVFQYIQQRKLDVVNNHLLAYMTTNLSINNKQTDNAKNIILKRNPSPEYFSTPVWDLEMGYTTLHHINTTEAIKSFSNFLTAFKGKFYVKDAYEKLSWAYYLRNDMRSAENARQQILKRGSQLTDADKQAYKNAKSGVWPNALLLKARLLSDGGYNNEALTLLAGKSVNDFTKPEDQLEFTYRVGRIYDDLNRFDEAVKTYLYAIKLGENRTEYYAARAALQIGLIYEKQGKKDMAISYYQKCLDMEDHDYKDSLDQKAKAGIARCKGQ